MRINGTQFSVSKRQGGVLLSILFAIALWLVLSSPWPPLRPSDARSSRLRSAAEYHNAANFTLSTSAAPSHPDPQHWLARNSHDKYRVDQPSFTLKGMVNRVGRPKAAIISLVRDEELEGMLQSIRQLEAKWNGKYRYPWIFFSESGFGDEFKRRTQEATTSTCHYARIPQHHWEIPSFVSTQRFMNSLEYLSAIGVGKGHLVSYRHMCRWNSGLFYLHPILDDFDFYWRVEPDVHFFCDIDYDVFRFVRDNGIKYGFNMNILDDARSFPSLWSRTRKFIARHPELLHSEADFSWLLDPHANSEYNNCQFFSNFEVGDLRFFRGEKHRKYFEWLDQSGGFFYERYGDAPVHTLSLAMFAKREEMWWFGDIGYQHDINRHCPPAAYAHKCACEPTSLDENFYKLVPYESAQRKPVDSCIRMFLGEQWTKRRASNLTDRGIKQWNAKEEYGGYEMEMWDA
ncbi:glycosyltransferase family 15 protein [Aulographum hederae CBS 113979]|uniref:Glycosyltransferase family 15 protein n=1 Tax=Aulographum hederae CBS 113979 TaxID=1176131 RepID=A0A6G1GQ63_9PEZI|nr:glycosyltransferase family 15 protein [Aulographum hederae CBS 113979]